MSACLAHQQVLWEDVITVGAVVKVDFVVVLRADAGDGAAVEPTIAVPPDDLLTQRQLAGAAFDLQRRRTFSVRNAVVSW